MVDPIHWGFFQYALLLPDKKISTQLNSTQLNSTQLNSTQLNSTLQCLPKSLLRFIILNFKYKGLIYAVSVF
jgi:hypothetical protein